MESAISVVDLGDGDVLLRPARGDAGHAVAVVAVHAADVGDVEFQPVHSWAYHQSISFQLVFCMASQVFLPQKCQM